MHVTVNGESTEMRDGGTVAELLVQFFKVTVGLHAGKFILIILYIEFFRSTAWRNSLLFQFTAGSGIDQCIL